MDTVAEEEFTDKEYLLHLDLDLELIISIGASAYSQERVTDHIAIMFCFR